MPKKVEKEYEFEKRRQQMLEALAIVRDDPTQIYFPSSYTMMLSDEEETHATKKR